jgi:Rne/Rng family ribonuclease
MSVLLISPHHQGQRLALLPRSTSPDFFYDPHHAVATLDSIFGGRVVRVHSHYALVDIGLDRPGILSLTSHQPKPTEGQHLLVQIKRESMDDLAELSKELTPHKGVQLTTRIRLTHRYFHYHPDQPHLKVSPKIPTEVAAIISTYLPASSPVTLRLAASTISAPTLVNALRQIEDLYQTLRSFTKTGLALAGPTALARQLRDQETLEVIVHDWATSAQLQPQLWPGQTITVTPNPFQAFDVEDLWQSLLQPVVPFGQRGSLLFEHPSGLTVIDVNTGGQKPADANATAVPLLLQHLRWRQLSGNILIDFVDSGHAQQRGKILLSINRHLLANTGVSFDILGWSALGHLQLRHPLRTQPLWMKLGHLCTTCAGWGRVL